MVSDEQVKKVLHRLSKDPREFISRLQIINEKGSSVRFNGPHSEQIETLNDLMDPTARVVINNKPRQIGSTTIGCAFNFDYCFWTKDAVKTVVVAHTDETTDAIFRRIRYFHDTLPLQLQRPVERSNKKELIFEDTGAGFRCLTAGGQSQGRAWTYQRLHADEVAFWPNADDVWASVTSTLHEGPHKKIFITSTANGPGGLYHRKVMEAIKANQLGDFSFRFRFFPWKRHRSYTLEPPKGFDPTQEEYELAKTHNLNWGQLFWRRNKISGPDGIGIERFRREFPLTVEDGFSTFDGSWFDNEYLNLVLSSLKPISGELRVYEQPEAGVQYAIGVDPSWCNGGDWAVAQVLSSDGRQVATLSCNQGGEIRFATKVAELAHYYKNARTLVEMNTGGAGPVVVRELKKLSVELWLDPGKEGYRPMKHPKMWTTNRGNKQEGYAHLRQIVNNDGITLNDHATVQELMHIREVGGSIEGQDGVHDDHAMALMLAEWNRRTLPAAKGIASPFKRSYVAQKSPFAYTRPVQ